MIRRSSRSPTTVKSARRAAVATVRGMSARVSCVGAVVLDDAGRLLVVRRRNPPSVGSWSVPGGRVEPGESGPEAVTREVREETGLDVTVGRLLGSVVLDAEDGKGTLFDVDDYLCTPRAGQEPVAGDDATDVAWVDLSAFTALDLVPGLHDSLAGWDALPR